MLAAGLMQGMGPMMAGIGKSKMLQAGATGFKEGSQSVQNDQALEDALRMMRGSFNVGGMYQ